VLKAGCRWAIDFDSHRYAQWTSPDDAVQAVVHRRTGLTGWDRSHLFVPDDLLRWRPVGENL
jgi:hypothetical protein